jgi:hypothetical protein
MQARIELDEYAKQQGWNQEKLIGWSEAADFAEWLLKKHMNTCLVRAKQLRIEHEQVSQMPLDNIVSVYNNGILVGLNRAIFLIERHQV